MKSTEPLLEEIERIRKVVAGPYGRLLCQSGAVALAKPGILSCLYGLIFQTARDVGCQIEVDCIIRASRVSPYVSIKIFEEIPHDVQVTFDAFIDVVMTLEGLAKEAEDLYKKVEEILSKCEKEINTTWAEQFKRTTPELGAWKENYNKASQNVRIIRAAFNLAREVDTLIKSLEVDTERLYNEMNEEKSSEFFVLSRQINSDKGMDFKGNRHLYWKYAEQARQVRHEDWADLEAAWKKITGESYYEKEFHIEKPEFYRRYSC